MAYRLVEDLADIGGRIGTDQQHFFSCIRETHGGGAGQRGFPYTALAGEEQEGRCVV